jgi:hypothetical protein
MIPGLCSITSGTKTSNTPSAIASSRRPDSRRSGNPETAITTVPSMGVGRPIKRRAFPSLVNNHAGKIERATDTAYLTK